MAFTAHVMAMAAMALFAVSSAVAGESRLQLVQTIQLQGAAGRLDHMALDANGARLFVANLSNDSLDVVDVKAGRVIHQIVDQRKIQGVAYAPGLDRIFVGDGDGGECNVFDGKTYERLHRLKMPDADNVRFDSRSGLVYVGHGENKLTAFDATTYEVRATVDLPGQPEAFQIDSERRRLYVNCVRPSWIVVVDLTDHTRIAKFKPASADGFYPLALDLGGQRLFIGCRQPAVVLTLAANSSKDHRKTTSPDADVPNELARVQIPTDIDDLFFDAKRHRLYASCGEGFLTVLEEKSEGRFEIAERIPTTKLARTCFFNPTTSRLYLGVPRQPGKIGPEIRVYQAKP